VVLNAVTINDTPIDGTSQLHLPAKGVIFPDDRLRSYEEVKKLRIY
jgi:hypothetical protein